MTENIATVSMIWNDLFQKDTYMHCKRLVSKLVSIVSCSFFCW